MICLSSSQHSRTMPVEILFNIRRDSDWQPGEMEYTAITFFAISTDNCLFSSLVITISERQLLKLYCNLLCWLQLYFPFHQLMFYILDRTVAETQLRLSTFRLSSRIASFISDAPTATVIIQTFENFWLVLWDKADIDKHFVGFTCEKMRKFNRQYYCFFKRFFCSL